MRVFFVDAWGRCHHPSIRRMVVALRVMFAVSTDTNLYEQLLLIAKGIEMGYQMPSAINREGFKANSLNANFLTAKMS